MNNEKIKVLFICPILLSDNIVGCNKSFFDLLTALNDSIEPYVLVHSNKDNTNKVFTENGVHYLCHQYSDAWIPTGYWKNIFTHPWRLKTVKYFRYDIPCIRFVLKTLKEQKIDLIHTNFALTSIGVDLANKMKLPHIWHIREYLDKPHVNGVIFGGRNWLRKKINSASARIVVSKPCRDFWKLKQENTYTINDAVLSVDDSCYVKEKQKYVLFCSYWLSDAKGVFTAVYAYGKSGLNMQGIRLKVVGNASNDVRERIKIIADEYKCADMLDLMPAQKDVKPLFVNAMAYINPSMKEGMGRTTAEAMFYGCPVVARASGGTLDLIRHGETGWLFDTEEECANLLKKVCTTDQEQIILKAQEFSKQNLSIENYGSKILEVYQKVLKN